MILLNYTKEVASKTKAYTMFQIWAQVPPKIKHGFQLKMKQKQEGESFQLVWVLSIICVQENFVGLTILLKIVLKLTSC